MIIPILGYLILFNDSVATHLTFNKLTSGDPSFFDMSIGARLKFLYLGLLLLGIANILYQLFRPYAMRIGIDEFQYMERALQHFNLETYIQLNGAIRSSGYDPKTIHGKYYDDEWQGFLTAASGRTTPYESPQNDINKFQQNFANEAHWVEAKNKYESLLRSILTETYFNQKTSRRSWLVICLLLAATGYLLLAIPSIYLMLTVFQSIINSIF